MDIIYVWIAKLFDKFKMQNPAMAAIIIFILGLIVYASENGLGDIIGVDLSAIVKWVSIVLGFLTGSRTTSYLFPKTEDKPVQ